MALHRFISSVKAGISRMSPLEAGIVSGEW
jgi:hypothetical protein